METSSTKIGTFIDLRRNWAFKQIFGTPGNEDILLALIQSVLPDKGITGVTLAPTEHMGIN
ncbi:MAG: PD-(D/E)XK nuclease family transposase, partial [Bacteroidales bacterium]|nr:PD-(D/E)XK nuclease family transposase [Bacteroidales bacterium]